MTDSFDPNRETRAEYDERVREDIDGSWDDFDHDDLDADERCEPVGSCDECGSDIYDDDWNGLCEQCAWHAEQGEGCDDAGGSGVM